jgi:beta-galactosidase
VGPYSGLVDEHDHVHPAPLPGALAGLLGIRVEEFYPATEPVPLDDGSTGTLWTEAVHAAGAEVLARYAAGPLADGAALTRHGTAWYASTRLADPDLARWLGAVAETAGVAPTHPVPAGVEAVRRQHADGRTYLFLMNHTGAPAEVDAAGVDLLTGAAWAGRLDAGGAAVLREG